MANTDKTGGAAFPRPQVIFDGCVSERSQDGMTLADYYAGQALNGYLKRAERPPIPDDAARLAWDYAEAMIEERNRRL